MSSKELSGHVVVKGEGWRVRLTTRGVWRHYTDDLHVSRVTCVVVLGKFFRKLMPNLVGDNWRKH